jgi:hypothetical protein
MVRLVKLTTYRLLIVSAAIAVPVVFLKYIMHVQGWELLVLGSLHSSVVAGTFFVIGFLLAATISDYKESERIPAEFAAIVENMYEDAQSIHSVYPDFDFDKFRDELGDIMETFDDDARNKTTATQAMIHNLSRSYAAMEKAGVPANFIVKLKQQQARLIHILFRVSYIQRITFIPSATILARTIVGLTIALMLVTELEPFYGGLALVGLICFMLIYIVKLIHVISTPFHQEGKTQDDVSLFLLERTAKYIRSKDRTKPN